MNYEVFLKEKEQVKKLSVQEQKAFYAKLLETEQAETSVRLLAYFEYAVLFYYEGDFRRAREILEPFAVSYQSYEYIPEMIACFNLMGVASQCEGEYVISRYFYTVALKIVEEQQATHYYAYEYNNISLTYIAEQNYEEAFSCIRLAEKWLPQSDRKMGSYIYLNKSDIYNHFGQMEEAVEAFETSICEYDGFDFLPDDTLICGVNLYYKLGDKEKYTEYMGRLLDKLGDMYASEFIDACKTVFECSLKDGNYTLADRVVAKMDSYMLEHPNENKVGLMVEQLKYTYAKATGEDAAALAALERKNHYYELIVATLEEQRTISLDEYYETHRHLQEAVKNEMKANRAKTQFLANMSHDIRTPMNAIVGLTNLMEHALDNPEKLENYLTKIQLSSRHMLGLINDLLDMTKIESGETHLSVEPMKLADQLHQIQDIIKAQIQANQQHFIVATRHICHENLIADAVRLRQVLLNILSNSTKYTPEGGTIWFEIEELPQKTPDRAIYRITVTDTGIGMDQKLLSHVFEPFVRGEESVVNKIQGTGLGMPITKSIIDLMGGTIQIDSAPKKGTRVTVTLEFTIDREEDAKMEPIRLLLLSENPEWCADLEASARTKPVSVSCAENAGEACRILEKQTVDVILLEPVFCQEAVTETIHQMAGPSTMLLALEEPSGDPSAGQLKRKRLQGTVPWPFFFTDLEKERNHLRSGGSVSKAAEASTLKGMHFLCAEDNALNTEILVETLKIAGASCEVYADGEELVAAFKTAQPETCDAILMDIQMPRMNGYEAARRIRSSQNPLGRTVPIIAMTANAFMEDVRNSFAAGMDAHISKPIEMADLERTVRRLKYAAAKEQKNPE